MQQPTPARVRRCIFSSTGFAQKPWIALIFGLAFSLFFGTAQAASLVTANEHGLPKSGGDARLDAFLKSHAGKPVLINFWATWCQPCREEMPSLQRLGKRWKDRGLVIVTVAVADNKAQAEDFLWERDLDFTVIHDNAQALSRPWGARVLPTTVILDRQHRVRLRGQGAVDWDAPEIDQQLQSNLN